jgi:hypothetical protein
MSRPRVFLSYSHRDDHVLESLMSYLTALEREGLIDLWSDQNIKGGEQWRREIDAALEGASIAVLLVSQEFLASSFVRDQELPRILGRHFAGRLTVLPVYVSPSTVTSDWIVVRDSPEIEQRVLLSDFHGFGAPDETLSELEPPERQRRFVELCDRIREIAIGGESGKRLTVKRIESDGQAQTLRKPRAHRIPFPRNRTFTGRESYLKRLHEELRSGKPAAVTQALAGLGGIGKTQLALEYCYRYGGEYEIVWWIRAEHESTRLEDIGALGHALGIGGDTDATDVVDTTIQWLDNHQDWLIVFDNAEHPDEIRNLLPKSGGGRIIITSRYPAWSAVAQPVSLSLWTDNEAVAYLTRRTGLSATSYAAEVAVTLGYLPLALAQAGAYIDETGCGFPGYLSLLKERPAETLMLRSNSSEAEKAIATVWDIAFARVAASNKAAIDLLNLFAFMTPDRINRTTLVARAERLPPPLRATVEDPFALDAAIGALRRYSLIDTTGAAFSVHRLVQTVVRGRLDNDAYYRLLSETAKDIESKDLEAVPSVITDADQHNQRPVLSHRSHRVLSESSYDLRTEPSAQIQEIPAGAGRLRSITSKRFVRIALVGIVLTIVVLYVAPSFRQVNPNRSDAANSPAEARELSPLTIENDGRGTIVPVAPSLRSLGASDAEMERTVREILEGAARDLSRVDYQKLSIDEREQYETTKGFAKQAEAAVAKRNWPYAQTLADKAATLASQLASSAR